MKRSGTVFARRPGTLARLLASCAAGLVACGGGGWRPAGEDTPAPSSSRLARILERGELRIATSADLPPLTLWDEGGAVAGFEVDLVRALAAAMGLEPRFVVRPFAELVEAGSLSALDDAGLTYAALGASTSADFVRRRLPRAGLVETSDYAEAIALLLAGEVDAMVADFLACKLASWEHADAGLRVGTPLTTEPLGIALPPDDPLLLNLVQNYLDTLERTGELTSLKARWLSQGGWLEQQP